MSESYSQQEVKQLVDTLAVREYVTIPITWGVVLRATRISPDRVVYADIRNGIPMAIDEDRFYRTLKIMNPDLRAVRKGSIEPAETVDEA